nr:MAG TPA: hypothetical protein [Caudoviricetes sp.]
MLIIPQPIFKNNYLFFKNVKNIYIFKLLIM